MTLPTDFSGLAFWLRADHVILNGGNVRTWPDQTANGNDFQQTTASHQPPWNASDANLNGRPSIGPFLGGANSGLLYAGSNTYAPPSTVFIVFWRPATVAAGIPEPWAQNALGEFYTGGSSRLFWLTGGAVTQHGPDNSASGAHAAIGVQDNIGGTDAIYVDSTTPASSASTGASPADLLSSSRWIGTDASSPLTGFFNWDGTIAEIFAYDRLLLASEIAALGGYLQVEYGIPFSGATILGPISGAAFGESSPSSIPVGARSVAGSVVAEGAPSAIAVFGFSGFGRTSVTAVPALSCHLEVETMHLERGNSALVTVTFRQPGTGTLLDPDTITGSTHYMRTGATSPAVVSKLSIGVYQLFCPLTDEGQYVARFAGSSGGQPYVAETNDIWSTPNAF